MSATIKSLMDKFFSEKTKFDDCVKEISNLDKHLARVNRDLEQADLIQSKSEDIEEKAMEDFVAGIINQEKKDSILDDLQARQRNLDKLFSESNTCLRTLEKNKKQKNDIGKKVEQYKGELLLALSGEHADKARDAAIDNVMHSFAAYAVRGRGFLDWDSAFRGYLSEIFSPLNKKKISTLVDDLNRRFEFKYVPYT